jgi:hypothetical protein
VLTNIRRQNLQLFYSPGDSIIQPFLANDPQSLEETRRLHAARCRDPNRHEQLTGFQPELVRKIAQTRLGGLLIGDIEGGQYISDRAQSTKRSCGI